MNTLRGTIQKVDNEKRIAFGWAYQAKTADGAQVVDHSGDVIKSVADDLEDAAYEYIEASREGDTMHKGPATATIVESLLVTPQKLKSMGLAEDALPQGWWIGMRINDDATWKRVKDGELADFSIAGIGEREPIGAEA